jgi:hypothetical protein
MIIPNFNDDYRGAGPDIGAHETGESEMLFGLKGLKKVSTPVMEISRVKQINSISKSKVILSVGNKSTAMQTPSHSIGSRTFNIQGRSIGGNVNGSNGKFNASGILIEKKR